MVCTRGKKDNADMADEVGTEGAGEMQPDGHNTTGDDSDDDISHQTGSQLPPEMSDLKRKFAEMEKDLDEARILAARLLEKEKKRNRRGPKKNLERGDSFVPLKKIAEANRFSSDKMYSVCKLVRMRLFGTMKYFSEYYKQGCLDRAYKELNIRDDESKSRYKDFIVYYIENKTNSQRNNCIYALRRCMLGLDTGGKYGNKKLDLCCSDSQSWFYSF